MKINVYISCLFVMLATQIPLQGLAQNQQRLTPVNYQKIAFIDATRLRTEYRERPHEWGHSIQCRILGPLYLPVVAIPSFLRANFGAGTYLNFYTEKWAENLGNNYSK
jgi:hypothetical protein